MRKNEARLHLLSSVCKLVAMSIKDWLLALKHIEAPKILSWEISRNGICMEFIKPSTWFKSFIIYAITIEKVRCYLYLVTRIWTKREISSLAKFMPKHNQSPTPNVTKDNDFTSSYKIIIPTKKIEINVNSKNEAT